MENNEDTIFVYEKSVEADMDTLNSIRKSIENERGKSGILLGFFTLVTIQSLEYFNVLPMWLKGACSLIIMYVFYLLIDSFCSIKINDGVNTDGNFSDKEDWTNRRNQFLLFHHKIIRDSIKDQKRILSKLSANIKRAVILLGIIVMIVFLNYTIPNMKVIFEDDKSGENTMQTEVFEASENNSANPMVPEKIERSANGSGKNPMAPEIVEKGAK